MQCGIIHLHLCDAVATCGGVAAGAALGAAILWVATNLLLRGPVLKLGGATANAWPITAGALCSVPAFLLLRHPRDLLAIPGQTVAVLLASVLLSMVLGDILQFTAIRRLGIALAMPIAASYPFLTLLIAAAALGVAPLPAAPPP